MIALSQFIRISRESPLPVYLQIADCIADLAKRGILMPGARIQPTRDLAIALSVHRRTIVAAYEELVSQNWIVSKKRRGFFIASKIPMLTPVTLGPGTSNLPRSQATNFPIEQPFLESLNRAAGSNKFKYIFNDGFPDVRLAPLDAIIRQYHSVGKRRTARRYLTYSAKEGSERLREMLADDLRQTRGIPVLRSNIVVTKGAQMAIFMVASLLVKPGDYVIVGCPNYFLVNLMFERLGAKLIYVNVDRDGIDVDAIAEICRSRRVRLIYVIPHHHHPTTVILSPARRVALLALAAEHKFAVIEDDFDFDLHYAGKPVLPMASQDRHGSVVYIGTLTKTLAPAIRIGYIAAPENLVAAICQHRFLIDLQGDTLLEEVIAELYSDGTISRHMKNLRKTYKERRDLACNLLSENLGEKVEFAVPEGGMSIWTRFRELGTVAVSEAAAAHGVFLCDGKKHNANGKQFNAVCLGFASMNEAELEGAIGTLGTAITKIKRGR